MSNLYIIATPIGNLEDISFRAIKTLKEADFVLAENPSTTRKLFSSYNIHTQIKKYNQNSTLKQEEEIFSLLLQGKNIALISEAGTPAISDPGSLLVEKIRKNLPEVKIVPIPGASALSAMASISGTKMDKFLFLGFLPHKKGRQKSIEEIKNLSYSIILYESKYRLLKLLNELIEHELDEREIIIGRELTKIFETVYQGKATELLNYFKNNENEIRGEFVVVIKKAA